ncbi:MAG: hypothetical protein JO024_07600 [Candidatus Eremiobacteraeota bacterium]|nr:hypothetical protein [Candidatus Eremiobacteraeota bacterium]
MKLACASTSFDRAFQNGDLTQLEWLDLCARELAADGVVCDVAHFPRRDSDYLAQVKKLAADSGLTVAGLWSGDFFSDDEPTMQAALEIADTLGAPLLSAPMQSELQTSWTEAMQRVGVAVRLAKAINVTLAARNRANTLVVGGHQLRRLSKEADSAWLRYGIEVDALDAASEPRELLDRTVLLWHVHDIGELDSDELPKTRRTLDLAGHFHGFLTIEIKDGAADAATMRNALRKWRTMIAEDFVGEGL